MSETATTETVAVDRAELVEAVAALDAASAVFTTLAGGTDNPLSEEFLGAAWRLYDAAFGPPSEDPAEPTLVAVEARSDEFTAQALDNIVSRAASYAERARTIRDLLARGERVTDVARVFPKPARARPDLLARGERVADRLEKLVERAKDIAPPEGRSDV